MKTLIVPMAGKSSRFGGPRPKWMLTHPWSGRFMGIEAVMGLNLEAFDQVKFVCLKEHEDRHGFLKGFRGELEDNGLGSKSEVLLLEEPTGSQSETVSTAIRTLGTEGFVFVKDADSYFRAEIDAPSNQVAYFDLSDCESVSPGSKSYIQVDSNGVLTNIVEKKVLGPLFSVGGYGFESASEFCSVFDKLKGLGAVGETYLSHVIFEMLLSGSVFLGRRVGDYKDWGTVEDWNRYVEQYRCLFVDIDGVLFKNTSVHFSNLGSGEPVRDNVELLRSMHDGGKAMVVLTTSRPEKYRDLTEAELKAKGVAYDRLLMGLPHCQRVLVNDFSPSNPYPSCSAVNLRRDEDRLGDFLGR